MYLTIEEDKTGLAIAENPDNTPEEPPASSKEWVICADNDSSGTLTIGDLIRPNVDSTSDIKDEIFYVIGIDEEESQSTSSNMKGRLLRGSQQDNSLEASYLIANGYTDLVFGPADRRISYWLYDACGQYGSKTVYTIKSPDSEPIIQYDFISTSSSYGVRPVIKVLASNIST